MFVHHWILGLLGGLLVLKLVRHARWRRGSYGRRGRMGWWRMLRELDLDFAQRRALRKELHTLRGAAWQLGGARFEGMETIVETLGQEDFDPKGFEAFADTQLARLDELRAHFMATLERIHILLRPEQREKLRAIFFGGNAPAPAPAGPYR